MVKRVNKKEKSEEKSLQNDILEEKEKKETRGKKSFSKRFVLFVFVLLLLSAFALWIYSHLDWFIVATVNGKPIWRTELIKELEKRSGKETASFLLNKALIYQEARNKNINVSSDEIKDLFNKYDEQLKAQGTSLKDALTFQGITEDQYKDELKFEVLVKKLLADKITVTDDEIKEYYDKNKDQFGKDQSLDNVKETIKQFLSDQKISTSYPTFIKDLESKAKIKRFFNF